MSRSYRRPYNKDSTRCNQYWKRVAQRVFRYMKEVGGFGFYKKVYSSWQWCDWCYYEPENKKLRRK